jgi:hypothetical protein
MIDLSSGFAASTAAEKPGVDVSAPERTPDQNSGPYSGVKSVQITATNVPDKIITTPKTMYVLKFLAKSLKKLGPAIKPTEPTNNIRPIF